MSIRPFFAMTAALAGFGLLAAACGGSSATGRTPARPTPALSASIKTITATVAGRPETILTDGKGLTLYLFTPEKDGKVMASGSILEEWRPLLLPAGTPMAFAEPALPGKLGVAVRPDGKRQVTYNEWPLYTFSGDNRSGDTNGHGVDNEWFVVPSVVTQDADGDADGTTATPVPAASAATPMPPAQQNPAAEAPAPQPRRTAPAFNDGDTDNRGGPSDGDGNG
jgi:predicted lipoprotein with Yx(FWY)xxD motif